MVDHLFDEGGIEKLVVGKVCDVFFCWEQNFGETGVIGYPVEENRRQGGHDWRNRTKDCREEGQKRTRQKQLWLIVVCFCAVLCLRSIRGAFVRQNGARGEAETFWLCHVVSMQNVLK